MLCLYLVLKIVYILLFNIFYEVNPTPVFVNVKNYKK